MKMRMKLSPTALVEQDEPIFAKIDGVICEYFLSIREDKTFCGVYMFENKKPSDAYERYFSINR